MSRPAMKYRAPGSPRWALWSWFDIASRTNPQQVYLRRLRVLNTPWFSVHVHWIFEGDTDPSPHDHPWTFVSWVLRGAYTEELLHRRAADPVRLQHRRWSWHRMHWSCAHRIVEVTDPLVTLVLTGPRRQPWSFWTDSASDQ